MISFVNSFSEAEIEAMAMAHAENVGESEFITDTLVTMTRQSFLKQQQHIFPCAGIFLFLIIMIIVES